MPPRPDDHDQTAEPMLRLDVFPDMQRVEIGESDWTQPGYAQWLERDDGQKVLRFEPMTVAQLRGLSQAIGFAIQRHLTRRLDEARDRRAAEGIHS